MSSYGKPPLPSTARGVRLQTVAVAVAVVAAAAVLPGSWPRRVAAANILGVFPIEAPSHHVVFDAYMSALHRRGHNVTVYTQFPDTGSEPYRRIRIDGDGDAAPLDPDLVTMDRMHSPSAVHSYAHMFAMVPRGEAYTRSGALRDLSAQPADAYDLIVTETCNTDLYLALAERFAAPFVAWTTSPMFVWSADRMAATSHPAYVPVLMTGHGERMRFAERARNAVARSVAFYQYYARSDRVSQRIATARYGPASTPLGRLALRTSFLFVDTHHTVWGGRPLPRNVVEVGGLHVGPPKPLTEVRTRPNRLPPLDIVIYSSTYLRPSCHERRFSERVTFKWPTLGTYPQRDGRSCTYHYHVLFYRHRIVFDVVRRTYRNSSTRRNTGSFIFAWAVC